jgi:hypothetical protein
VQRLNGEEPEVVWLGKESAILYITVGDYLSVLWVWDFVWGSRRVNPEHWNLLREGGEMCGISQEALE